ncbi:MAG: hypothetical protein HRT38_14250 [Alteromonadaceae bacterium]|nr:hypothetical protein [Alteromonadaceae bacterium]
MKNLLTLILLFVSINTYADDQSEIDELANPVMELFKKGDYSQIVSTALSKSSSADYITKSDMDQTNSQFDGNFKIMGKFYSYEILHEQGIDGTFMARWYLLKFKRQPVLLHMEFYKPDKTWNVYSIQMITEIDDYIESRGQSDIGKMGSKPDKES